MNKNEKQSNNKIKTSNMKHWVMIIGIIAIALVFLVLYKSNVFKLNNNSKVELSTDQIATSEPVNQETTVQSGTVTVWYLDENGNEISAKTVKEGNVGDWYDIKRKQISRYVPSGDEPITRAGFFELGNIDVKFIYKGAGSGVLTKTENEGVDGATQNSVNVIFDNQRTATDYGMKIITKDKENQIINGGRFAIRKDEETLREGDVSNGQFYVGKIAIKQDGKLTYQIEQTKETPGYIILSNIVNVELNSVWNDESKKFEVKVEDSEVENVKIYMEDVKKDNNEEDNQTDDDTIQKNIVVEIINEKQPDEPNLPNPPDEPNPPSTPDEPNLPIKPNDKREDGAYEIQLINKSGAQMVEGGKFKVTSGTTQIIDDYTKQGKLDIGTFKITEDGKDTYTFIEEETGAQKESGTKYKTIIGEETPGKIEVTKKYNEDKKRYDITVKYNNVEGFSAEVKDNVKVLVYVETQLDVEKYDLSMKKFVSEVDGELVEGREPKVEIDENGKINYVQNGALIDVSNSQQVTYTLRMYNESEKTGKGKRIIEHIPDGLVFLPENEKNKKYGWKLCIIDEDKTINETDDVNKANAVVTDYLVDKEIKGLDKDEINDLLNEDKVEDKVENKDANKDENKDVNKDENNESNNNISEDALNYLDAEIVFEIDEDKIKNEDRTIENIVTIDKNPNDDNPGNDDGKEKLHVKYFDLSITKYIKDVKIKNNIKETTQEIGLDKKDELIKIDVANTELENTTITVTYGLLIKNVGGIEGYATEIVDNIPKDFKLVENGIWKLEGEKAVTTKLENKLLKPGESATVDITLEWKLTQDNIGSKINEAKITKYENPYDAEDKSEDNNNNKEEFLVMVRTGEWLYYLIPVIVVIGVLAIVILLVVRAKKKD